MSLRHDGEMWEIASVLLAATRRQWMQGEVCRNVNCPEQKIKMRVQGVFWLTNVHLHSRAATNDALH
jgi:hypothetical protein